MCDSMVGKTVDVVRRGRVIRDNGRVVWVRLNNGIETSAPKDTCTVVVPDVREGDLVEAREGDDLVRGRVKRFHSGEIINKDGDLKISGRWRNDGFSVYFNASIVTIIERADGSKP